MIGLHRLDLFITCQIAEWEITFHTPMTVQQQAQAYRKPYNERRKKAITTLKFQTFTAYTSKNTVATVQANVDASDAYSAALGTI